MAASSSLLLLHRYTCNFYSAASSVPARFRISSPLDRRRRRIWSASGSTKSMADLVKTNARRDGEEQVQALEQEALIRNLSSDEVVADADVDAGGGIEAIANRLSKWIVAALFGSVLLLRHDGAALWAVIGSVSNSALSVALKRLLNQERPVATLRSDPGMPSSHAQSISFISVFSLFSVIEWLGTNVLSLFLGGLILALGSYFTWLRVSQKLHTTSQVVVGAIVGSVYSTLWYVTWNSLVLEAFTSSFSVQIAVFLVAAASALGFAVYVLLNWFKDDR